MNDESTISRRRALGFLGMMSAAAAAAAAAPAGAATDPPTVSVPDGARERRGYADSVYGQIHYRYVRPLNPDRRRRPLLCLHPSPLTSMVYDNWLIEMGRDRDAIAPDTPGYGGSDAPPGPPEIADYAKAFIGFLDSLHTAQVDVMGYHTGSETAVELARKFPERIRKVVMISAPIFTPEELADLRAGLLEPRTYESVLASNLDNWRRHGKGLFRDEPSDERYADFSIERMRQYRISTWGHRAAFNYDLAAVIGEVRQPILILNPEDDLWKMTPRAMKYAKTATLHDLPGWTHGHLDAHTAEMAAIVRQFLDANA